MPAIRGLLLLAVILTGVVLFGRGPTHHGKLGLGIWYWHSPFKLSPADLTSLRDAGITTLYVRAGTFTTDGKRLKLMLPQKWATAADGVGVVAVYNFDPGLLRHFDQIPVESMASDVALEVSRSLAEARVHGVAPEGVQFDVDCPTRVLPKYAEFLRSARKLLGSPSGSFSITALPTWLSSSAFLAVAREVDFVVPQFYEGRVGKDVSDIKPISDPDGLRAGLRKLDRLGLPYYAGIPAYGHALIYDEKGRLSAMYRGLSAEDAIRHPSLRFESSEPVNAAGGRANPRNYVGEDLLKLRAVRPDANGKGMGHTIAYLLPSNELLTSQIRIVEESAGASCRGMILYRFPEPDETTCLATRSIVAAVRGEPSGIDFAIALRSQSVPFAQIGEPTGQGIPKELTLEMTATGNSSTQASRDALSVTVEFDRPGVGAIAPGDFDSLEVGRIVAEQLIPCGRVRATAVRLHRFHVLPGQRLQTGAIELLSDGPTTVRASWTAQGSGGFRTYRGSSPTRKLAELK